MESLKDLALQLQKKPAGKKPLIIFESTLAPTTMNTLIRQFFSSHGLEDGRDLLLGNSPNRVMPGRLVERVISSDKVIGGLNSITPHFIQRLYSLIVTKGRLHPTNCLTAEIVKTVENAYRDVRIAYSAEIARFCDDHDIDYYQVREDVNRQLVWSDNATASPNAVPAGGLLIPTVGVGGHCLPKDGILLLWKKIESGANMSGSLILEARRINDESPAAALRRAERLFGDLSGKSIALLGVAYRFNSEDTRNSPTFVLARYLIDKACRVYLHDPYVNPADQNLTRFKLEACFTRAMEEAVESAEYMLFCTAHHSYIEIWDRMIQSCPNLKGVFDGCNLFGRPIVLEKGIAFGGIAKGIKSPSRSFLDFVRDGFRAVETGFANELDGLIGFINQQFARERFDGVDFRKVQEIAGTCVTGCQIVNPGPVEKISPYKGFLPRLVDRAINYPSSNSSVRLT
jgi:UDP-N-acetyl-D-mannosaminuronic acid dehydrogenase